MKPPQYNLGIWLGAIKSQLNRVAAYYGMVSLLLVAVAARPQLEAWFPWLNFWLILAGLAALVLVLCVGDYVLVLKAENSFAAHQVWVCDNPTKDYILAIIKTQDQQSADIKLIKAKLGIDK